jgi:hypothetical protein
MSTSETKRRLLISKWHECQLDCEDGDMQWRVDELEAVVLTAMYWMQDVLILKKPMTDPRKILTMLERSL